MPTELAYSVVDAFSTTPFGGNPAAVLVLPREGAPSDAELQQIAAEFNFAETAFATPLEDCSPDSPHFNLRWMTPEMEVDLCGHATLATSKVLFSEDSPEQVTADQIRFETRSGTLTVSRRGDKISMDFPAAQLEYSAEGSAEFEKIKTAVEQAAPELKGHVRGVAIWKGYGFIAELDDAVSIEGLAFDVSFFTKEVSTFLSIITQPASSSQYDVYSRVFAPLAGVPEDPVTGAAHTVVGPYWRSHSQAKLAFSDAADDAVLRCRQVSKRGGDIDVIYNKATGRVELIGSATLMMKGTLRF